MLGFIIPVAMAVVTIYNALRRGLRGAKLAMALYGALKLVRKALR